MKNTQRTIDQAIWDNEKWGALQAAAARPASFIATEIDRLTTSIDATLGEIVMHPDDENTDRRTTLDALLFLAEAVIDHTYRTAIATQTERDAIDAARRRLAAACEL